MGGAIFYLSEARYCMSMKKCLRYVCSSLRAINDLRISCSIIIPHMLIGTAKRNKNDKDDEGKK